MTTYGLLCVLCALCGETSALAEPQEAVLLTGAPFVGELLSIDASGSVTFRVSGKGEPTVIRLNELVRWGNPIAPRPQTIVVLADGSRIVTAPDWSGGAAVQLKDNQMSVLSDIWGTINVDRSSVKGIVFAQRERVEKREQLVEELLKREDSTEDVGQENRASDDVVMLVNGDRLSGTVTALERGSLRLKIAGGETKLPLSRVEVVRFGGGSSKPSLSSINSPSEPSLAAASSEQPNPSLQWRGILVGARDGSLVRAMTVEANGNGTKLELDGGVRLAGGNVQDIVALQVPGGKFVYLSDLFPASYRFVPYLHLDWPLAQDHCVAGGPLTVDGKRYSKGIGLHSACRVTYTLDAPFQRFDSMIAIDDGARGRGSVVFGAYVERDGKWSEAYKSDIVRGGEPPQAVSVDLRGATGLTLTVDYADRGDELDYADWLDARLIR
jgi:hypothetical protein